jgi:hypothetical protein
MVDQIVSHARAANNSAPRPDSTPVAQFVRNGFVTVQTSLPSGFHADIRQRAGVVLDREGNWGNNILPRLPELQQVFDDPAVRGALSTLLGPTYAMHPHRYCHRNEPGSTAQRLHKDTREFSGDRHLRHHRPRWLIAFYYPQDVHADMGPTAIVPRSQYYLEQPDAHMWPEELLCPPEGTVALVHFGMWHRATANLSAGPRYMFKFEFARMDEPDAFEATEPATDPVMEEDDAPVRHPAVWAHLERWIRGARTPASDSHAGLEDVPALVNALGGVDEPVRLDAAYALAAAGTPAVAAVAKLLRESNGLTRRYAAHALTGIGGPAVEALMDLADDQDEKVRVNAIDALGDMGSLATPAVETVGQALHSPSPWVRRHAAEALGTLGPGAAPAVPQLAIALKDQQQYVRMNAATAIARIGPAASEAVPALVESLRDTDRYARGWAALALRRIGTPQAMSALVDRLMVARWCSTTTTEDRY